MALAEHYAAQYAGKKMLLGLLGRSQDRLNALAARITQGGGEVRCYAVDVSNGPALQKAAKDFIQAARYVHVVIANAGISRQDDFTCGDGSQAAQVVAVNVTGVIHTLAPFMPTLIRQKGGALVAIGSVAGWRGLPGKGAYCASKAAVETLLGSYRAALAPAGVQVTYVAPGWVNTALTATNPHPMPFIITAQKAAACIAKGVAKGKHSVAFPWQMRLAKPLIQHLPAWLLPRQGLPKMES